MNHNSEEQGNRNEVNKINGETLVAFQNREKYSSCSFLNRVYIEGYIQWFFRAPESFVQYFLL